MGVDGAANSKRHLNQRPGSGQINESEWSIASCAICSRGIDKRKSNICASHLRSSAQYITPHTPGDTLPIPDADPLAAFHRGPYLLEHLGDLLRVPHARVALYRPHCSPYSLLLLGGETRRPDHKTGNEKELLGWVAGLEGLKDVEGFVDGECDTRVMVARLAEGWRGIGATAVLV